MYVYLSVMWTRSDHFVKRILMKFYIKILKIENIYQCNCGVSIIFIHVVNYIEYFSDACRGLYLKFYQSMFVLVIFIKYGLFELVSQIPSCVADQTRTSLFRLVWYLIHFSHINSLKDFFLFVFIFFELS